MLSAAAWLLPALSEGCAVADNVTLYPVQEEEPGDTST